MIPQIKEINLPSYATLCNATATYVDMGEKTITSQVSIDGQVTPDFSFDWEVHHMGEKFIMPLRQPQALKENTSLNSKIDLTFQHWAIYQLKRWYFFTLQSYEAGVAVADKYIASVSLNLKNFCDLYAQLLKHYYGDSITIDLNPDWEYVEEPIYIDINYSYMWDVLIKFYELFAVRWEIVSNGDPDHYVIKVGYPMDKLDHIFEYGFEGGLMKVERQVQDDNIRNMLLGRGGDKNIPYRYFKKQDPDNPTFQADPDWVEELANVYFDRLRSAEFRSYIQGWKAQRISKYPGYVPIGEINAVVPWAYRKGYADTKFDPVEFVKDDESIRKYGELLGGLDNNDEIYPSIQGVVIDPYGRIDQAVDVGQVTSDNVNLENKNENSRTISLGNFTNHQITLNANETKDVTLGNNSQVFQVPDGWIGNIYYGEILKVAYNSNNTAVDSVVKEDNVRVYAVLGNQELAGEGLSSGKYYVLLKITLTNTSSRSVSVSLTVKNVCVTMSPIANKVEETFDIWIKNIWQTSPLASESAEQYAERVWRPILGDHIGNDAAVCFSSGLLSTSEDYEFKILGQAITKGIHYDTSKSLKGVQSHWRLTLVRSTADYDSLGKLVPNLERQGKAGDYFYFTGIELTHYYVKWAEERLHDYKLDQLAKVSDIQPSWVVSLDKVRIGTSHYEETQSLLSQLHIGSSVRIADKRFISSSEQLSLYLQQITYKYNETQNTANLTPNVEIVLGTSYVTSANPVSTIQGQIDAINRQIGSISNISQAVRSVGDNIYLRKDVSDRTPHNLTVGNRFNVGNFITGYSGASVDSFGNAEVESIVVRSYMKVFELIYNRINALEGDTSFADSGQIEAVIEEEDGTYTFLMRQRWEGDFTAFQKHDILFGYVNSITRNETGVLEDGSQSKNGFLYYKAWCFVNSVDRGANTLNVTLYADTQVPAQKNFPFSENMTVARWGNTLEPSQEAYDADPDVRAFLRSYDIETLDGLVTKWINTRQQSFFISSEQGNLVELMGVNKPILERENYGVVLGQIPEGLLDDETMKLINQGQPYLYARGIVVQDLIRIGYEGVKVRTPNFRGEWEEETALDDTLYYRITDDVVDVVTHDGALWQVNPAVLDGNPKDDEDTPKTSGRTNADPPSDSNPDWIRLTSFNYRIWNVKPSVNTIYIREGSYSTSLLQCVVMMQDGDGEHEITTPEELDEYGMELTFSLDGVAYREFWVRKGETVEGIDLGDDDSLDMGGNNVPWIEIGDYIYLSLREKESGDVKDAKIVPVVKDGTNGEDGESIKGDTGEPGKDGKGIEQRYKVVSSEATAPVISEFEKSERAPSGWSVTMPPLEVFQDLYAIQASIDADNNLIGQWSDPFRMTGHDGEPGRKGLMPYPAGVFNPAVTYYAAKVVKDNGEVVSNGETTPVVMYGTVNDIPQYYALREGKVFCAQKPELHGKYTDPASDYANGGEDRYWDRFDSFNLIFANVIMAEFAKLGEAVFKDEFMFSQGGYLPDGTYTEKDYRLFGQGFEPNFQIDFRKGHVTMRSGEYYGFMRQKMVKITDENIMSYYDPSMFAVSWMKAGGSIWLETATTVTVPYYHQNWSQEQIDLARSYLNVTIAIYNNASSTSRVTGFLWEHTIVNKTNEEGHRVRVEELREQNQVTISSGCMRTFKCICDKDDSGYERLSWEASEEAKIFK